MVFSSLIFSTFFLGVFLLLLSFLTGSSKKLQNAQRESFSYKMTTLSFRFPSTYLVIGVKRLGKNKRKHSYHHSVLIICK